MSLDDKKITAMLILEIMGRPAEYINETLKNIVKTISEEKGIIVKEAKISEPAEIKERKDFYTSFAELEIETEEVLYLAVLIFKYMPAHVEIISPPNILLSNSSWNDVFNEITRRLHGYEEIARILQTEKKILENQLKTIAGTEKEEKGKKKEKPKRAKKK
jgi:hypothetical protein